MISIIVLVAAMTEVVLVVDSVRVTEDGCAYVVVDGTVAVDITAVVAEGSMNHGVAGGLIVTVPPGVT